MYLKYKIQRWREETLPHWFARQLPSRIAYWASVTVMAHATTGKYGHVNTPSLLAIDALKRWHDDRL